MRTRLFITLWVVFAFLLGTTGCSHGGLKGQQNDVEFDSIDIEETYHYLNNPKKQNSHLEINFIYPSNVGNPSLLAELQKQFVSTYFGENYEAYSPEEAVKRYTEDYLAAYKDLDSDFKEDLSKADERHVGAWY